MFTKVKVNLLNKICISSLDTSTIYSKIHKYEFSGKLYRTVSNELIRMHLSCSNIGPIANGRLNSFKIHLHYYFSCKEGA